MRTKHAIGLAAVALAFAVSTAVAGPETLAEAKSLAASQNKPILIDFYAVW